MELDLALVFPRLWQCKLTQHPGSMELTGCNSIDKLLYQQFFFHSRLIGDCDNGSENLCALCPLLLASSLNILAK